MFIDVGLIKGCVKLFGYGNSEIRQLLPDTEEFRELTVPEFRNLALNTNNEREINSIAFFCWICHFEFHSFAGRLCKRIATRRYYDVFSSVMLLQQSVIEKEDKALFVEALAEHPGSTVFEVIVSATAIKDLVSEVTIGRLLRLAISIMNREGKPSFIKDSLLYKALLDLGDACGSECPTLLQDIKKMSTRLVKETSSQVKNAEACGFIYSEVLQWVFVTGGMKETVKERTAKKLCDVLFEKGSAWSDDEIVMLKTIRNLCGNGYPTVFILCSKNVKTAISLEYSVKIKLNIKDRKVLQDLKAEEALYLLCNSVDVTKITDWYEGFRELFSKAFTYYRRSAQDLYNCVYAVDPDSLKNFVNYYAGFLEDFVSREAFELMKKLDKKSQAYSILMEKCVTFSEVLTEEENDELYCTVLEFVLQHHPYKYESIFEEGG